MTKANQNPGAEHPNTTGWDVVNDRTGEVRVVRAHDFASLLAGVFDLRDGELWLDDDAVGVAS